jgi:predicted acylesterase/phospholipase RssA
MIHVLVHSGGGANGAWGLGVLKYMVEVLGLDPRFIVGTSVGALNGAGLAMYSLGNAREGLENLLQIWAQVTPDQIYKHWWPGGTIGDLIGLIFKTGLYNTKPLHKFVREHYDQGKLEASDRQLAVTAVNLDTGELEYFDDQDDNILTAIMASSSYPVFFMPVEIAGNRYSDGGLVEIAPVVYGIEAGLAEAAEDEEVLVDVIVCQPRAEGSWDSKDKTTLETMPRMLGSMTTEIANNDVDAGLEMAEEHDNVTVRVWQPANSVGSGLDFSQPKVQKLIQEGYEYAEIRWSELGEA